jgi:hypothetical protein
MGAVSGAFAAAATTPLDVIKTTMMCTAASRPSMASASRAILAQGGPKYFFRCTMHPPLPSECTGSQSTNAAFITKRIVWWGGQFCDVPES